MDLRKLNSATKYPSILTYHEMGDRGRLTEKVQVPFTDTCIYVSEKVDGTNGRIVLLPGSSPIVHGTPRRYLIGSREEFLSAEGDLIYPPDYGIVDALRPIAGMLPAHPDVILVLFLEVFGGDLPASKQYTDRKQVSVRLFDVAHIPLGILEMPVGKIASWRDHAGQQFMDQESVAVLFGGLEKDGRVLEGVPDKGTVASLPLSVEDTYRWLKTYETSECNLGGGKGRAEGVVVRTADRKLIAKMRFEDYERTLGVKR